MSALMNRAPAANASAKASRSNATSSVARNSPLAAAVPFGVAVSSNSSAPRSVVARPQRSRSTTVTLAAPRDVSVEAVRRRGPDPGESTRLTIKKGDPNNYALGILGDLHMDPRDLEHSFIGRDHVKSILDAEENTFVVRRA